MTTDMKRIMKIINAVKARECLWNVHSPDYAKRDKLEKAWQEVAQEVGRSEMFCREKWRNVRTGFLRSIQNNFRIVPDDRSNDFQAVRRKRFYLYDHMKFLLPSAETLERARKRRKLSKLRGDDDFHDFSENTMQEYTLIGKYETNSDNDTTTNHDHEPEEHEAENHFVQILKELETRDDDTRDPSSKDTNEGTILTNRQQCEEEHSPTTKKILQIVERFDNSSKNDLMARTNNETMQHLHNGFHKQTEEYSQRDEDQLIDFFRGNVADILALSKKNQRLFKRKMLELIGELHDSEETAGT